MWSYFWNTNNYNIVKNNTKKRKQRGKYMAGKHSINDDEIPKAFKNNEEEKTKKKSPKKKKAHFRNIVIVLLVLLIAIVGSRYWYVGNKLGEITKVDINKEELGISQKHLKA